MYLWFCLTSMIEFSFFANSWQFRFGIYFTSLSEAVSQKCSGKKVFWKISRDSLENACFGIWRPAIDWKRDSSIVVFCRFCKVFNNTFFTEHLEWLLLILHDFAVPHEMVGRPPTGCLGPGFVETLGYWTDGLNLGSMN